MKFLIIAFSLMISTLVFAQVVAPEAAPVIADKGAVVVAALTQANDKIPATIPLSVLAVIGFLAEVSMRILPTSKPRSLFILAGTIFALLGSMFTKISGLLDSIVQNIKDAPDKKA